MIFGIKDKKVLSSVCVVLKFESSAAYSFAFLALLFSRAEAGSVLLSL